jgi:hypothetical protein
MGCRKGGPAKSREGGRKCLKQESLYRYRSVPPCNKIRRLHRRLRQGIQVQEQAAKSRRGIPRLLTTNFYGSLYPNLSLIMFRTSHQIWWHEECSPARFAFRKSKRRGRSFVQDKNGGLRNSPAGGGVIPPSSAARLSAKPRAFGGETSAGPPTTNYQ